MTDNNENLEYYCNTVTHIVSTSLTSLLMSVVTLETVYRGDPLLIYETTTYGKLATFCPIKMPIVAFCGVLNA